MDGPERNISWKRLDHGSREGYAEIRKDEEKVFDPGDVVTLMREAIHSGVNETGGLTVSLHICGEPLNYTGRLEFDPARNTASPVVRTGR